MSRWLPFTIFFSALCVRLIGLGTESLWYDEAFSAHLAALPLPRLIEATAGDVHPPLWYLIEWLTVQLLGTSEFSLRLPAAIASAASASEIFLLIRHMEDERAGLIASGMMIVSGGMHYYGQEARMYSLLTLLVLFALRSVLQNRVRRFAPALALLLYTQNLAALYAAPLGLLALWQWRSKAIRPLALAGIVYLPWTGVLVNQIADVGDGFWLPADNFGGVLYSVFFGTFGSRLPAWAELHGVGASIGMTTASVWTLRSNLRKYTPLLALAFAPPLALYGVSEVWRPLMLSRALLPAGAGVLSLWAISLIKMNNNARLMSLAAVGPLLLMSIIGYYFTDDARRIPFEEQTSVIRDNWIAGDAIYNINLGTAITYDYYLPANEYPSYLLPGVNDLSQSLTESTKSVMGLKQREASVDQLITRGYQRLFILWIETPVISDYEIREGNHIIDTYPVIDRWVMVDRDLAKLTIYLVDISGGRYGLVQPRS